MTFWLKVYSTGYVMSSGSFTNHRNGPGYQLYYQQSLKRFKFLLETRDKRWTLLLHEEVGLWTHMAFTWRAQNGLTYYEDGNLSTFTDKPVSLNALRQQNYTPVITLARPSNLMSFKEFGKFEISQFAIWLKELSAEDIAGIYQDGHAFLHQNFVLCCHFKSGRVHFFFILSSTVCIEQDFSVEKGKIYRRLYCWVAKKSAPSWCRRHRAHYKRTPTPFYIFYSNTSAVHVVEMLSAFFEADSESGFST